MNKVYKHLFILMGLPVFIHAQENYKTPTHSLGFELSTSMSNLMNYHSNFNNQYHNNNLNFADGYGGSVVFPYQYAPKSAFIGVQSGIGFYMWGVQNGGRFNPRKESLYTVGIPIVGQFKVSKSFWIESGLQGNIPVYNTISFSDKANYSYSPPPGRLPIMEMQAVLGFRYHLFRSLAFKFRMHLGLTPAYHIHFPENHFPGYNFSEEADFRYRFAVAELGICYLFPLKK